MLALDGPCQKRPKTFSRSDGGMPSPSSSTRTTTHSLRRSSVTVTTPGAVAQGVLDEVEEDLLEAVGVGPHLRQPLLLGGVSELEPHGAGGPAQLVAHDVGAQQVVQVDRAEPQVEAVGVEPRDVEQLGDEPGQPVGVGLDRLDHESLLLVGEAVPAPQQAAREAGHRRQRRPQLVGDGREHGRLVALGPLARLGVAQAEHDPIDAVVAVRPGPHVAGRDEHLLAARADEQLLEVAACGSRRRPTGRRGPTSRGRTCR